MTASESLGNGLGNFRFRQNHLGPVFLHQGDHLLFIGLGYGPPFFRLRLETPFVRLGLIRLEFGPYVGPHVNIGDINGKDLKSRSRVQPLGKNRLEMVSGFSKTDL
jgi:hypothetical protein